MKIIIHSTLLITIVVLVSFWARNPTLSHYSLQAIAALTVIYLLLHRFGPKQTSESTINLQSALFLTAITLMLVFSTGGAVSPIFFILYFLLFCLSLLFEPIQTAVLSIVILIPLILGIDRTQSTIPASIWGNLATLVLITPMATVFGRKLIELQNKSTQVEDLETKIIIEETTTSTWIAGELTPTLVETTDTLISAITDKNLPIRLSSPLTHTYGKLKSLLDAAKRLEKSLDQDQI